MLFQFFLGAVITLLTLVIAGGLAGLVIGILDHRRTWLVSPPHALKLITMLAAALLAILLANLFSVCAWALLFISLGSFSDAETAVYFALVSVTTLGFGDILLERDWRLLSGFAASNGLLLFGVYTAFIVEVLRRVHGVQHAMQDQRQES